MAPVVAAAAVRDGAPERPLARVKAIGTLAAHLLGGDARTFVVLGGGSAALYLRTDDEIIWLGRHGTALHRRAMIVSHLPRLQPGVSVRSGRGVLWHEVRPLLDVGEAPLWNSQPIGSLAANEERPARLRSVARIAVTADVRLLCSVAGALLGQPEATIPPDDPFVARATALLLPLARTTAPADLGAAVERVLTLVGLGPGLTPSGDDVASGFLFALACAPPRGDATVPLSAAVERVADQTHPLSLVLLRDCARGHAAAPAHELVRAVLARDAAPPSSAAVARLLAIGQHSGGDLLAGLLVGLHMGSVSWQTT
jgi:hypothetical protein